MRNARPRPREPLGRKPMPRPPARTQPAHSSHASRGRAAGADARADGGSRGRDIYPFAEIEPRAKGLWNQAGLFRQDLVDATRKFYCLNMFPYPSGDLHAGHGRNYIMGDVVARWHMMRGYQLLAPM